MSKIITGERYFGQSYEQVLDGIQDHHTGAKGPGLYHRFGVDYQKLVKKPQAEAVVYAYVNHGRWVAGCPWCCGAEFVFTDNLLFFCGSCGNVAVGGKPARIVMPSNRAEIEAILEPRPVVNQNWYPSEISGQLKAENAAHGVA